MGLWKQEYSLKKPDLRRHRIGSSSLWISLLGVDFSSQRQALGWEGSEIKKKKKRKKKRKKKEAKQKCYSSFSPKESTDF